MICNDFLVVKVSCWSYVFNIIKSIWILKNIKNKKIVEKVVWKCAPMTCLLFASDDVIPGKHNKLEMWANAQRDGRRAEYRWRPLFNAAKFAWRPLLDAVQ